MDLDKFFAEGMEELNKLPPTVKKATAEILAYDQKCSEIMKQISVQVSAYAKVMKKLTKAQKTHYMAEIEELYEEARRLSQAKVDLCQEIYDSVDENIQTIDNLDKHLRSYSGKRVDDEASTSKGGRRKKKQASEEPANDALAMNIPSVEMPIDPSEPRYCTCRDVSHGSMVCCDNPECAIEWFHYACVGMETGPPKHIKWYCDACRPAFKHMPNQFNYDGALPPKKARKTVNKAPLDE